MNSSESIAKLAEALAKAQAQIEGAKKTADNPFYKSKYADLSEVWEACRKPLTANGLSVVQTQAYLPEAPDMVVIDTRLLHSSGEWIEGRLALKPVKADPQSIGSAITYARRYSLQSIVGIAPEDDDGNAASHVQPQGKKPPEKAKREEPAENIKITEVKYVTSHEGETNGKAWRKYGIVADDDKIYGTFSESFADIARTAQESGDLVTIYYDVDAKGRMTVKAIEILDKAA